MLKRIALVVVAAAVTTAPAAAFETKPADKPDSDRLICKKNLEPGSLVRKRKQCLTWAEWEKIAVSQRTGATKLVDDLRGRPPGT